VLCMPHRIFGLFGLKINFETDDVANNNGRCFFYFVTCFGILNSALVNDCLFCVFTFLLLCRFWANTVRFNFPFNTSMLLNVVLSKSSLCVLTITVLFTFFDICTMYFLYSILFIPTDAQYAESAKKMYTHFNRWYLCTVFEVELNYHCNM